MKKTSFKMEANDHTRISILCTSVTEMPILNACFIKVLPKISSCVTSHIEQELRVFQGERSSRFTFPQGQSIAYSSSPFLTSTLCSLTQNDLEF